ncbi:unnamed protein product [Trifolium pratense]|uniref:Uncharacterized protein n=1 Tax=Trifolium pratense TaxID=57577 RepID=A0ACB0IDZ6_TRIPR|nr:unnamed protein product [Trifolium pratense]
MAAEGLHVLMEALVERNLFTGYSVGEIAPVSVSHLQFADDTLLMGTKCWANVRVLRAVLVLFESMSGLRVNFHKSLLVRVNIPDSWLGEVASALCCKVGKISFLYLGLPIWGDPRRLGFWEPVLDRLKNRLAGWRSRFLSFGGHLVLLKFVLTSLPVYALSFFKAPSENKSALVVEMFMQGWGIGGAAWVWRRQLRAWEEELLGECQSLLLTLFLQDHVPDRWKWQSALDDVYTVRGAYQLLTTQDAVTLDDASGLIWHRQVPLKVFICAWRLLQDRLPTKANLVTRGILSEAAHHCVSGCEEVETAQHLFLSCSTFGVLWSLVSSWIGSSLVTAQTIPDHFVQFTYSAGGLRARRSFMQLIWLACVWVMWTERNYSLFRGSANTVHHMLDKIKTFSFRPTMATVVSYLNSHSPELPSPQEPAFFIQNRMNEEVTTQMESSSANNFMSFSVNHMSISEFYLQR